MTNLDRLKLKIMQADEKAFHEIIEDYVGGYYPCNETEKATCIHSECKKCYIQWLKQEERGGKQK